MPNEPNAVGNIQGLGPSAARNDVSRTVRSRTDLSIPGLDKSISGLKDLIKVFKDLDKVIEGQLNRGMMTKFGKRLAEAVSGTRVGPGATFTDTFSSSWRDPATAGRARIAAPGGGAGGGSPGGPSGPGGGGGGTGGTPPPGLIGGGGNRLPVLYSGGGPGGGGTNGPVTADMAGGQATGNGVGAAINNFFTNLTGQNGIMGVLGAGLNGIAQLYGAVAGGGIQYAYNRINGPTGNMNMMLQLANALAPNATMMSAATGTPMTMNRMVAGLAQRMPIMGTQQDMLSTILAGQSVGALMTGTPGRNAFFESTRQMQALNPGMAPANIAGNLAGYIGNTQAQQRGVFYGGGAFTMIGQGGSYKTLAEWAHGITKFLEQQRPGGSQGKSFTKEELITQNFPGSNINSWFQMMGVPQTMVDYWWQYVLTSKGGVEASQVTSDILKAGTEKDRGVNLGYERLRNVTQSARREFLMGGQMYNMYALRESADRRFNVAMQGTDTAIGHMLQSTNVGRMLSLLPTPIMEMLMPMLVQFATSPVGAAASAVGGLMTLGDVPIGDVPYGDASGYGHAGGTTTAHLSPDLAKRVDRMLKANPRLKISSSYRDTVTQNRLRKNGASAVAPASKSAHTRGWAVDIGPTSQAGWLMQNAGKFGLQTGAAYGEPWHIQSAGTMTNPIGDPGGDMPYGDSVFGAIGGAIGNVVSGVAGGALSGLGKAVMDGMMGLFKKAVGGLVRMAMSPITNFFKEFIGSGDYSSMIDTATGMFSKLMTAPLSGLVNVLGKADTSLTDVITGADGDQGSVLRLLNQPYHGKVPVTTYAGFTSKGTINQDKQIFGDPIGDPLPLMSSQPTTVNNQIGSPVVFQTEIHLNGVGSSPSDAKRVASVVVDHMADQLNRRKWLVS